MASSPLSISIFVEPPSDDLCGPLDLGDGTMVSVLSLDQVYPLTDIIAGWIRLLIPLALLPSSYLILTILNEASPKVCS